MKEYIEKLMSVPPQSARSVMVGSGKGGVGKTLISYSIAHGIGLATGNTEAAIVVQTDIHRNSYQSAATQGGRMFSIFSGQAAEAFSAVENAIETGTPDQVVVVDSAGTAGQSRQAFDEHVASYTDLVIVPVTPDRESIDEALKKYDAIAPVREANGLLEPMLLINNLSADARYAIVQREQILREFGDRVFVRRPISRTESLPYLKLENYGDVITNRSGAPILSSSGTEQRYMLTPRAVGTVRGLAEVMLHLLAATNPVLGGEHKDAAISVMQRHLSTNTSDIYIPMRGYARSLKTAGTTVLVAPQAA